MATKTKELTKTEVSDNGEIEEKSSKQTELDAIVNQYNDAVQKRDQFANLATRCLGAIEVMEKMVKREDDSTDSTS